MKYRVKRIAAIVPTASMADIAFLLIIFFMLTTSFSPERTSVKLPESAIQEEVADDAAIVALSENGEIHYTDGEADSFVVPNLRELSLQVRGLVEQAPFKEFLIKADRLVTYEQVDEVLDELRKAGVKRISLLTRPRMPPQDENPGS